MLGAELGLPDEIVWYLDRFENGWLWLIVASVILHLAVPFWLLLFRDVKQDPRRLAGVAGLLLVMRYVENYWTIKPAFPSPRIAVHWLDAAAPVAIGGLWLGTLMLRLRSNIRDIAPESAVVVLSMVPPDEGEHTALRLGATAYLDKGMGNDEIVAAMTAFRADRRPSTVMNRIAKGFTDEEIRAIADWLAAGRRYTEGDIFRSAAVRPGMIASWIAATMSPPPPSGSSRSSRTCGSGPDGSNPGLGNQNGRRPRVRADLVPHG